MRRTLALWVASALLAGCSANAGPGSQLTPSQVSHNRSAQDGAAALPGGDGAAALPGGDGAPALPGDGLKKFARYKALCLSERVEVDVQGNEVRVAFQWVHVDDKIPTLLVDGAFASVLAVARGGTGREIVPLRVDLARRRPSDDYLQRYFKCEVVFDAPLDLLVLDASLLDEPFVTANEDLMEVMLPGLEAALHARLAHSVVDDVKAEVRRQMSGRRPSIEGVAEAMHLSVRTLQRRLGEAGTTYQTLLDDERRHTARRLLTDTDLDSGEIAFLLGFDEPNSFSRAFHGWEGMTPANARRVLS